MATPATTLLQIGVDAILGILYTWVGMLVVRREVSFELRPANRLFATWWLSLAGVFALAGLFSAATRLLGLHDLPLAVVLINVLLTLVVIAVWALVAYLTYLYSGSQKWLPWITALYVGLELALLYLIAYLSPTGFDDTGALTYERKPLTGAPSVILGLFFSVPVIIAALAYGSLFFQTKDPTARYRVGLVSGGFLIQFGWSALSSSLQLNNKYPNSVALALVGNTFALLAAIAVVLAFRPPAGIQRRLNATSH